MDIILPDCFQMNMLFSSLHSMRKIIFKEKGLPGVRMSSFGRADGFSRFFLFWIT